MPKITEELYEEGGEWNIRHVGQVALKHIFDIVISGVLLLTLSDLIRVIVGSLIVAQFSCNGA